MNTLVVYLELLCTAVLLMTFQSPVGSAAKIEQESQHASQNSVAGARVLTVAARSSAATTSSSSPVSSPFQSAGTWSSPIPLPIVPIHMHLLPNGKVLIWQDDNNPNYNIDGSRGPGSTLAYVWDVSVGALTQVSDTTDDLFCSGHSFLPDGRLLITGGHISDNVGIRTTTIFDYRSNSWSTGQLMNAGRWYPTNTTLGNGEVLVVSGDIDRTQGVNTLPQVWQTTGGWRSLTTALRSLPLYPMMHLAPNGMVFNSGPNADTGYLDTTGTGSWTPVANHNYVYIRDTGSSVMYDDGKILVVGGGDPPTATAEVIDLNAANPSWQDVAPMGNPRRQMNATLLPDGMVLVTGGTSSGGWNDATNAVRAAELWNPSTNTWTQLASMQNRRLYHTTAILLPDGRVICAGGGRPNPTGDTSHPDAEIFSPPYLFNGGRPSINSAPDNIAYGQTFSISTPNAGSISKVTLVALPSVTHAFDMNQRFKSLSFSVSRKALSVVGPANGNVCPPGYYMLFILNSNGVPSIAKIISIGPSSPPSPPAVPVSLVANAGSSDQINLSWTDSSNSEDGFRIEQCQAAGCTNFAEIATVGANVTNYSNSGLTPATTYQYRIRAYNSTGNSGYSNVASASTGVLILAPSNLTGTAVSGTQINLNWSDNSDNEVGFRIERCVNQNCKNFSEITTVEANVTAYSDSNLKAGRTYRYRVRGYAPNSTSPYSNIANITTNR
ncbi:MAG TPA: galactose oxidase-like domain-containing protein [Pyrinomonadaceae bacterium]|nr:galactose oxidase-like domain-containing protein [Pyrinomonadaceae bacterium]